MKRVVDHLHSKSHLAASDLQKKTQLWEAQSENHPWVNVLKKHQAAVIDHFLKLAVDVYNDSLLETPTARSWLARSLAHEHAKNLSLHFEENGFDAPLKHFSVLVSTITVTLTFTTRC